MRLFIAVDLSDEQKGLLLQLQDELKHPLKGVKWVKASGMHITLKFLGEVEQKPDTLIPTLEDAVFNIAPFELSLQGLGVFPNLKKPRVIWSGVKQGHENLIELSSQINSALEKEGFEKETRKFTPHVTLGRIRQPENYLHWHDLLDKHGEFYTPASQVPCITLYESILSPQGAKYVALEKIYLK